MDDLVSWLEAQIAEDERIAHAASIGSGPQWRRAEYPSERAIVDGNEDIVVYDEGAPSEEQADHIAAWDPARVLAECEAKRAVIELYKQQAAKASENAMEEDRVWTLEPVIREFGALYARLGRPGYQESWRPA